MMGTFWLLKSFAKHFKKTITCCESIIGHGHLETSLQQPETLEDGWRRFFPYLWNKLTQEKQLFLNHFYSLFPSLSLLGFQSMSIHGPGMEVSERTNGPCPKGRLKTWIYLFSSRQGIQVALKKEELATKIPGCDLASFLHWLNALVGKFFWGGLSKSSFRTVSLCLTT